MGWVCCVTRKPDFFIVGAPKCGTTALTQYLSAHPDIFMARKEMHHFGNDLHFGAQFYRRDAAAYLAEFQEWQNQARAGEASVWYLYSKTAAAEIKAFNPDARVIIMLREPVDMLHSLFYQFRFDGNEPLDNFERALAAEGDRHEGRRIGRQTYLVQGLFYRETIRFAEQVKRYFDAFGRDRVHIVLYDDLIADVAGVYRRTLEFLEVDARFGPDNFKAVNNNKFIRNRMLRALFNDRFVRSTILAIRPCLPRPIFSGMQKLDAALRGLNSRAAKRPPLSTEFQRQLRAEFAREVDRLGELLGRDLSHWHHGRRTPAEPCRPSPSKACLPEQLLLQTAADHPVATLKSQT